jgi:hypothetical protein
MKWYEYTIIFIWWSISIPLIALYIKINRIIKRIIYGQLKQN